MKRILCGPRVVAEALRSSRGQVTMVLVAAGSRAGATAAAEARAAGVPLREAPRAELDALARGLRHQDVIAIAGELSYLDLDTLLDLVEKDAPSPPLLLALDSVQDVQNVGSLLRSAVGLGASGVLLCRHNAAPVSAAAVRASAGASEHARVARVTNLAQALAELRERGITVVGTAADGSARLWDVDLRGPTALVLGSEGKGMRRLVREACDVVASIPLASALGSLNVAVAGALALYEARRQRG